MDKVPTRERLKALIERRYSTRIHMSLILASCGLVAMGTSWSLLHIGVHSMLVRYPVAISLAYAMFIIGVWIWLRITDPLQAGVPGRKASSSGIDFDIPSGGGGGSGSGGSVSIPRGGGTFDGGGASSSWAEARPNVIANVQPAASVDASNAVASSGKGCGFSLDGLDGDGIALLILAAVLVLAIFAASGYLIWCAPDVLTEATFGAALTGTLAAPARKETACGWMAGVVRKTWWPFALVLVVALVFAGYAAANFPEATTFKQAIHMALA